MTARFTAMNAEKYARLENAAAFVADSLPTSLIMLTMPTGPDRSFMPTAPASRSPSPRQTMRTKSSALYHAF